MVERIKQVLLRAMRNLWGGRASRLTFLTGVTIYIAVIVVTFMPAEMVHTVAPQLLWELYAAVMIAVSLASILGICRLYVQRLHDMGWAGYWAIIALAIGPVSIIYLAEKYASWRWASDHDFPTTQVNDAAGIIVLAAMVLVALAKGSDVDNKYGEKPEVVLPPHKDLQTRWTAILLAVTGVPFFGYLGFFNDRIWVGKTEYVEMPMTFPDAPGRSFMHCWGFKGVSAYATSGEKKKDSLLSFHDGFLRDGYGDDVFDLFVDEEGNVDIVTAGKSGISYKKDGFEIFLNNPNKVNFYSDFNWNKNKEFDAFKVMAYSTNTRENFNNEVTISFIRKGGEYNQDNYSAIYTRNMVRGSGGMVDPYINGQVMVGSCMKR